MEVTKWLKPTVSVSGSPARGREQTAAGRSRARLQKGAKLAQRGVMASLLGGGHERQDYYCVFDDIGRSHGCRHFVHRFFCTHSGRPGEEFPGEEFQGGCGSGTAKGHAYAHRKKWTIHMGL